MNIASYSKVNIFLFKGSNRNIIKWCKLFSDLTIKTLELLRFRVFLLLILNKYIFAKIFKKFTL